MSDTIELWKRWGRFGHHILQAGRGGGYVTLPDVLDDYERALGLEPMETWLIKRYLRNYWKAGEDVFPSSTEIARRAKISRPTVEKYRDQLAAKGLVRITGRKGKTNGMPDNRVTIDLSPLFDALFVCILCDPNSKTVKHDSHADIRELFSDAIGHYSREEHHHFENIDLPIDIETAKVFAERLGGFTLAWDEIAKMQGKEAMEIAEVDRERYARQLGLKRAVEIGSNAAFSIRWNYKHGYKLLQWLVDSEIPAQELCNIVREYAEWRSWEGEAPKYTFRLFETRIRLAVETWKERQKEEAERAQLQNTFYSPIANHL